MSRIGLDVLQETPSEPQGWHRASFVKMVRGGRMSTSVGPSSVQFVGLHLACPHCAAPVTLVGQLALTPTGQVRPPCGVCTACGNVAYLALKPV